MSLASAGDQILAYQVGAGSTTFICAVNCASTDGTWQAAATNTTISGLPTGLTNGECAVALITGGANWVFNTNIFPSGTRTEWLTAIGEKTNWLASTNMPSGSITITGAGNPNLPVITITNPATASVSVPNGTATYDVQGTCNTSVIGQLSWTNTLTGEQSTIDAAASWTISGLSLNVGTNTITISGTNNESVSANASVTITRLAMPPTNVQFTAASASIVESGGAYTVTVYKTLAEGNVNGEVRLGGTATEGAGADYTIDTTNFAMNGATTSATFIVTINDDAIAESPETVILTLTNVAGGTIASPSAFTLTITDNDIAPLAGDEILAFRFNSQPYLVVSTNAPFITVSDMGISSGSILTNVTTLTVFPDEPYIESSGGWTADNAAAAKNFFFTITPTAGYALSVSGISFRAYASGSGPSAFSYDIAGGLATFTVNAPDSALLVVSQDMAGVENQSAAVTVMIQGWTNGSRATTGSTLFKLDDVVIYGSIFATGGIVDGIPVTWWDQYSIPTLERIATNNADSDTANNLEEYLADTNPTNSDSYLGFVNFELYAPTPAVVATFKGGTQAVQIIEYTTNLMGGDWSFLSSNTPPTFATNTFGISPSPRTEFFRVRAHR